MRRRSHFNQAGFNIIELCIVTLLVCIILLVSMPAFGNTIRKTEANKELQRIALWLTTLHARSVNQQIDISVTLSNQSLEATSNRKIIGKRILPPHLKISFSSKELQFFGSGVQSPSTIRILYQNETCLARLSLRGRITTECLS